MSKFGDNLIKSLNQAINGEYRTVKIGEHVKNTICAVCGCDTENDVPLCEVHDTENNREICELFERRKNENNRKD